MQNCFELMMEGIKRRLLRKYMEKRRKERHELFQEYFSNQSDDK